MFRIDKGVHFIGVDDHDIDLFENQYPVPNGITYNSYLLDDEKIAVVDTTDARKGKDWIENLLSSLHGRTPDYLVVEHMEPDHSSLIAEFISRFPDTTLVMSAVAAKMLPLYLADIPKNLKIITVKDGDEISLGEMTLRFVTAPMVHWPEVIMAYVPERKILFSADAFGTFGTLDAQTDDWTSEARRYYVNIVGKYGPQVQNLLKKVADFDIRTICPLHGPVLRENLAPKIALYDAWSSYRPETDGILIACASIHGNTRNAADYLAMRLKEMGAPAVVVADLTRTMMSEAVAEAFRFPKIILCASSYDAGLFTPMYTFIHTLQIKALRNRDFALVENGSWAPSAGKVMRSMLEQLKDIRIVGDLVTIRGAFKESDHASLDLLAEAVLKSE